MLQEREEETPLGRDLLYEAGELLVRERLRAIALCPFGLRHLRDPHAGRRIRADDPLLERRCEEGAHGGEREAHGVAGDAAAGDGGDEPLDVARLDLRKPPAAKEWDRVALQARLVVASGLCAQPARRSARVALDPFVRVVGERDAGEGAELAAGDVSFEGRLERFRLGERAGEAATVAALRVAEPHLVAVAAAVHAGHLCALARSAHRAALGT